MDWDAFNLLLERIVDCSYEIIKCGKKIFLKANILWLSEWDWWTYSYFYINNVRSQKWIKKFGNRLGY